MTLTSIHVVLGGNGVVGRETIRALSRRGLTAISVGRTPSPHPAVRSVIADLRDPEAVRSTLAGADAAYLAVGLPYSDRDWETHWLEMMENTVNACVAHGTLLVYLDNVSAYGHAHGPMTEKTEIRPATDKGHGRAKALEVLHEAARSRGLAYTVGRSADFYGPGATTSVFNLFALSKIAAGKRPTWLFDATQPHSLTYTPDIGDALAILGTDARARGRVWHLPTASPALTGDEYFSIAGGGAGSHHTMSKTTMRIGSLWNANAREALKMAYHYTEPYLFDSSTFESTFGVRPTPYAAAIATTLTALRNPH